MEAGRLDLRVVFFGSPEFAELPLEQLILNHYEVVAVYTQPDRPAGRGCALSSSAVKQAALARHLPVVQPAGFKTEAAVAELAGFRPDVIVVAAYGQILPGSVLGLPRYGCLNLHPSLLPRFRGASPVAAAILSGEELTGVSLMLLDEGMDTGPVLAQVEIPIEDRDTTGSLTTKLSRAAADLLLVELPCWTSGEITPQPQEEGRATYSPPVSKADGEIDWRLPATTIWRRIRAFSPWPGSNTSWRGRRLKITRAVPVSDMGRLGVGQVVALPAVSGEPAPAFGVGTGEGILGVLSVQAEGKREMSAAEFLRGQRQFIGASLPS
jgi:methionyl-tRNA formyltransferase